MQLTVVGMIVLLTSYLLHSWWRKPVVLATGRHWSVVAIDKLHHRFGQGVDPDAGLAKLKLIGLVLVALVMLVLVPAGLLSLVVLGYLVWRAWPAIRNDVSNLLAKHGRKRRAML